jgi:CheY-like chemotaxis protein
VLDVIPIGPLPGRRSSPGLARWLLALLLAALPILSCGAALGIWLLDSTERQRAADLGRHVETLSVAIDGAVLAGLRSLETLAGSRQLELRDIAGFREEARRLLAREPTWHTIALVEGGAQLLNLRYAPESPPPAGELPVGPVLASGRAAVSEMADGRILLSVPVHQEGAVRGALVAVLEASALAGPLGRIPLPPGWSALLLDGEGRRLAGGPIDSLPIEALGPALLSPGRPQPISGGLEALVRPVGETGWSVVVAAPPPLLPPDALLWLGLALFGAALSGAAGMSLALRGLTWRLARAAEPAASRTLPPSAEAARQPDKPGMRLPDPWPLRRAGGTVPAPPTPQRRLRVLVAEDVPASRLLLQALLQRAGHDVVAVEDGEQAVVALRGGGFDLGVLDLHMPRMGGMEAAREIRALAGAAGSLPLLVLTAERTEDVERTCLEAGFDAMLTKPFESRRLIAVLETLLRAGPEGASSRTEAAK